MSRRILTSNKVKHVSRYRMERDIGVTVLYLLVLGTLILFIPAFFAQASTFYAFILVISIVQNLERWVKLWTNYKIASDRASESSCPMNDLYGLSSKEYSELVAIISQSGGTLSMADLPQMSILRD